MRATGTILESDAFITSEDELVSRFTVDARRIARFFERRWCYRIEAEDLEQIALMGAVLAFRKYSAESGIPLALWIRGKMRFAVQDAIRGIFQLKRQVGEFNSRFVSIDSRSTEAGRVRKVDLPPNCPMPAVEASMDIETLLHRLPEVSREVVRRRHLSEESLSEIAADFGVSDGRISQIDLRGLKRMKAAA